MANPAPQQTSKTQTTWTTPEELRSLEPGADVSVLKGFAADAETMADTRRVKFTISTGDVDRDNDTIYVAGWDLSNFKKNPVVLWAHSHSDLPVGKCVELSVDGSKLVAVAEFATHPFAETVYQLVKGGFLRATSVGFRALKWARNETRNGIDFMEQELLEFSIVPVPANQHALIAASASGVDLAPLRKWVEEMVTAWPSKDVERFAVAKGLLPARKFWAVDLVEPTAETETVRWNKSLSKAFDITSQEFPAKDLEQKLASDYLDSPIKLLHHGTVRIRSVRMGAFLTALDEYVGSDGVLVDDLRNLDYMGREAPPIYEDIKLNSKLTRNFLVDGMRFMQWNGTKLCVRVEPRWYGLEVTHYSVRAQAGAGPAALEKIQKRAKDLNFLRGEAFTLGGEFIERGSASLDDLILEQKNSAAVARMLALVNGKGESMECRGALLVGPPGTGKTLSGRILMDNAKATFLWISSRDFAYNGGYWGMADAFDMARECAPTVLFIEDVDSWLDGGTVDLMKTEMDGIAQHKGVLTVLTTNYPERLPKALIDRPGRFHDVLRFDLPTQEARAAMLAKWMPGLSVEDSARTVEATAGISGAHIRELARFAGILAEQDGLGQSEALGKALEKLQEQRDLITSVQASGSRYRAPSFVSEKTTVVETIEKGFVGGEKTAPLSMTLAADEFELPDLIDGEIVFEIDAAEESDFDFDAEDVKTAIRDVIAATMGTAVREATERAMNQLRGRVD